MGYQLWGDAAHEWAGAVMLILFIVHHILNRAWYKSLAKGRYTPMRVLIVAVDMLLFIAVLAQMYSGIIMSRHVFAFLPVGGGMALARRLHILGAYWGFLLMSVHLGMHWNYVLGMVSNLCGKGNGRDGRRFPALVPAVAGALVAFRGFLVFVERDFLTYMFFAERVCIFGLRRAENPVLRGLSFFDGTLCFPVPLSVQMAEKDGETEERRRRMKKGIALLLAACMALSACGAAGRSETGETARIEQSQEVETQTGENRDGESTSGETAERAPGQEQETEKNSHRLLYLGGQHAGGRPVRSGCGRHYLGQCAAAGKYGETGGMDPGESGRRSVFHCDGGAIFQRL